jgi:hypothetical protein
MGSQEYTNTVRIGYARVSGRSQDHQLQLDALVGADCREVVVETASTRGDRPELRRTLTLLKAGDTLVVYKPDRIARSMKELLVLLEDQLHARDINLHILTGICAGLHRPNAQGIADKMLCSWSPRWPPKWNANLSRSEPSLLSPQCADHGPVVVDHHRRTAATAQASARRRILPATRRGASDMAVSGARGTRGAVRRPGGSAE